MSELGAPLVGAKKETFSRPGGAVEESVEVAKTESSTDSELLGEQRETVLQQKKRATEMTVPLRFGRFPATGDAGGGCVRKGCAVGFGAAVLAVNLGALSWMALFIRRQPPPPPPSPSLNGFVHCAVRGDDACWLSLACTAGWKPENKQATLPDMPCEPSWSPTNPNQPPNTTANCCLYHQPNATEGKYSSCCGGNPTQGGSPLGGYELTDSGSGSSCSVFPSMTAAQIKQCAALENNAQECLTDGESSGLQDGSFAFSTTQGCLAGTIVGSFDWKVTTATNAGCQLIGGSYYEISGRQYNRQTRSQDMWCPGAMQARAAPAVVDGSYLANWKTASDWKTASAGKTRGVGECYIPQTETVGAAGQTCTAKSLHLVGGGAGK
jgi:hypothetical protein